MTPSAPDARRRALCAALALVAPRALRAGAALPAVDLIVELRLVDAPRAIDAGAADVAVIDSRGHQRAPGPASTLAATQRAGSAVQAVRVTNGGRARLQLVQTQALVGALAAWGAPGRGRDGAAVPRGDERGAALATTWVELADGFDARVRWPGGRAPVQVDIAARRVLPGTSPGAAAPPAQAAVETTVQGPLGDWLDVADLQPRGLSPGALRQRLQLRVRLP